MMKRTLLTAILVLTLLLTACGTQAPTQATGAEGRVLRVAVDATFPPAEYKDEQGNLVGFDIDYAKALAAALKMDIEFIDSGWEGIIPGLLADRWDLIISSMSITPERAEQVDFVQFTESFQVVLVRPDNATIHGPEDLAGHVVGVQLGTVSEAAAREIAGIAEIKTYNNADAFQDLAAGRVDAVIVEHQVAAYRQSQAPASFKVVGEPFRPLPIGIALRKDEPELKAQLEAGVQTLLDDGTYQRLLAEWYGL